MGGVSFCLNMHPAELSMEDAKVNTVEEVHGGLCAIGCAVCEAACLCTGARTTQTLHTPVADRNGLVSRQESQRPRVPEEPFRALYGLQGSPTGRNETQEKPSTDRLFKSPQMWALKSQTNVTNYHNGNRCTLEITS